MIITLIYPNAYGHPFLYTLTGGVPIMVEYPEIEIPPVSKENQNSEDKPGKNYEKKMRSRRSREKSLIFGQDLPQKSSVSPA